MIIPGFCRRLLTVGLSCTILAGCGAAQSVTVVPATAPVGFEGKPPSGTADRVLYRFKGGEDGVYPAASLVNLNGTFYGTTAFGGRVGYGTVFSITPSGKEHVIYSFRGSSDGSMPYSGLTVLGGKLYGTTSSGGRAGGTVFSITPSGKFQVIYSFEGSNDDGDEPVASLVAAGGVLYGTTTSGGQHNWGTVFKVTPSGDERTLYSFAGGNDGQAPSGSLIFRKGVLYGTTRGTIDGSFEAWGTVFSVTTSGNEHVLYRFKGPPDGGTPYAGLALLNDVLYGTTVGGGASGWGTVFALTLSGKERILHSFKGGSDGQNPRAPLSVVNGKLYGTTILGGNEQQRCDGCGTIFQSTTSGSEGVIYSFQDDPDGAGPAAGLVSVGGELYGTTESGGYGYGTVFTKSP